MLFSEAELSAATYAFLAGLVYDRSRIRLGPDKRALVAGRLARHLEVRGCASYEEYCDLLRRPGADDEIGTLIDLISTNHTQFFREPAHFEALARMVLPELAPRAAAAGRPLRVWSAAAASGEEPYSLAIVLAEQARLQPPFAWRVHASDISRRMLDRCRLGIYDADKVKLPDAALLARYFRKGFGRREGCVRLKPEIRRHVAVDHVNLFQPAYPVPQGLDVVFCRNVMIYFDVESRQELVKRLFEQLAPGGYLFVGHAESLLGLTHRFETARPGIYRRPA
jgi:chemotaxis protein methyltransferase CheR